MNKSPFSFQPPTKFNPSKFNNKDMLFNKKKISSDVLSMSSSSASSRSSSRSGTSEEEDEYKPYVNQRYNNDDASSSGSDDSSSSDDDDVQSSVSGSSDGRDGRDSRDDDANDKYDDLRRDRKSAMMNEINEKRELLYQMDRLESKGYRLPFKFDMESDLHAMRAEYNKLIKEKEVDASIRFQRKMLMAFVTGTEYLNTRYDPFAVRLEGWSEQVHDTLTDYDDIFEELHAKYKSTGKKMSPELRLFISLSGSAFMFHLTNRMFKENPLPNVEHVLKSNPELMKQFQQAAAKQYITGDVGNKPGQGSMGSMGNQGGGAGGLFGMVSNLFNNMGGGPSRPSHQTRRDDDEMSISSLSRSHRRASQRPANDINNIINNVHSKISLEPDNNNIETLSISDEEITSIIEDTADIRILRNNKNKNTRTLNL
jgi:hypothetical protein